MQDVPCVMTASDISLGGIGVGISLGLQPHEISTPSPPREISDRIITLRESCYTILLSEGEYQYFNGNKLCPLCTVEIACVALLSCVDVAHGVLT